MKPRVHPGVTAQGRTFQPEDSEAEREDDEEGEGDGGLGVISDRRLVRAARLLRFAAAADGRSSVDRWDCLLLLHVLPPPGSNDDTMHAAVDYLRGELADSATIVLRIEGWLDTQLHRLWRDAEFNAAAKLPRPGSDSQRDAARGRLWELRQMKRRIAELGAVAEGQRDQAESGRSDSECEEHGGEHTTDARHTLTFRHVSEGLRVVAVVSVPRVLASHGWLAPSDLELIYGAGGGSLPSATAERAVARGAAWERSLWSVWRELTAMEGLLVSLSEPNGPARPGTLPPAAVGTLRALSETLPVRSRKVLLEMLSMDPMEHVREWPELHRGRGYKNQAALIGTRMHPQLYRNLPQRCLVEG